MQKIHGEVQGVRSEVRERLDPLTQSVGEILTNSREPIHTITKNLNIVSNYTCNRSIFSYSDITIVIDYFTILRIKTYRLSS